ncbi:S-methyl-5'-thioadenosine phosphorylase [Deferribacter abyssi]|uniref:S-methyl-5'-thioadenosine phosphorylase n=1 Tax=Deferribacter abyssi TaxID=213806 RepID=UPI003C231289
MKIGIIGGSGLYEIDGFEFVEDIEIVSHYGKPTDKYKKFYFDMYEFYFLNRHGQGHKIPPHKVNYRANIYGFKEIGVEHIISFTAVGGINELLKPGDILVPDNAIDFTSGRESTYYDEEDIHHIDFTNPFCPELRNVLIKSVVAVIESFFDKGTYICTNGPRLETAAEIKVFRNLGADIVGMTLFPECVLARELEICYANVSVVTNYAAGTTTQKLTVNEVLEVMRQNNEKIKLIVNNITKNLKLIKKECECKKALKDTKISK